MTIHKFPGTTDEIDADLIDHDNNIEVTIPKGFSKAEIIGMLHMAALIVMDTFQGE